MSSIFKVGSQTIKIGKGWVSAEGIQHPSTWGLWSSEEKKTAGISEIVLQELPDSRLYNATHEDDGSVNSTAKNLADTTKDGKTVLGVKSELKAVVQQQQYQMLEKTDWAIIRKADKGTAIPSNIQTYRDAIRSKATEMETAIDDAGNIGAIEDLFFNTILDADGNATSSGILYKWPELA